MSVLKSSGSFQKFTDADGNLLTSINKDGSIFAQSISFPSGSVGAGILSAPLGLANGQEFGILERSIPMASGSDDPTFSLQTSPLTVLDFGVFNYGSEVQITDASFQVIMNTGSATRQLKNGLNVDVNITANTAQQGSANVVGISSAIGVVDIGAGGQVVDEIHGFECDYGDIAGATVNEFLSYRVHFSGSGGTRLSHIAFCSNTSDTNFVLTKGLFVSPNYQYGLDLNPTIASCLGTAPICHSTQNGRRVAPTILDGWYTGTGDPNGVVTAGVGSIYSRRDGGALTAFYVKESGSGNTGWVAK